MLKLCSGFFLSELQGTAFYTPNPDCCHRADSPLLEGKDSAVVRQEETAAPESSPFLDHTGPSGTPSYLPHCLKRLQELSDFLKDTVLLDLDL